MVLNLQSFQTLLANGAAAAQAACSRVLNLRSGSMVRAILEASASVGLWIQYLIVQVWAGARLSTASGVDVDSFVEQFTMERLPAVPASGFITFTRFSTVGTALVPVDTTVMTADQSQSFEVTGDTTNPAWNAAQNGYLMGAGVGSVTVPALAITAGSGGNVQIGAISLMTQAVSGVDLVTNAEPFVNGVDGELDPVLKTRFQNFINTRSKATISAISFAIDSVQQGLSYLIAENQDAAGNARVGNFVVTLDNGTGNPPASLISQVYAAIDAVRPIGSTFTVRAPVDVQVAISMTVTVGPNGVTGTVAGNVNNAIAAFLDSMPVGATLPYSRLAQVAWDADPNVVNVTEVLLNGATADVSPGAAGVIKAGTIAIDPISS